MIETLEDQRTLLGMVDAVSMAGFELKERFSANRRPASRDEITNLIHDIDAVSTDILRKRLASIQPDIPIEQDENAHGLLSLGERWVIDPVEGAINHVHGTTEWCITATLIRDNVPVHAAVHLPLLSQTYTASRGRGAFLNGAPIRVSVKNQLNGALVGTGQATPGESAEVYRQIADSTYRLLQHALTVSVSVPSTMQLVRVADGRMDAFWQLSAIHSGLVSGALLVQEAGGTVTDINGRPWSLESHDFLAAPPQLSGSLVELLGSVF
ncbi:MULTISPECIES: inositol monophosphatase family protein [Rhizobium/Agrobacterium group]|uniref:3'(2'),5'-bisphosphate nucleotidase CysQ n=1 Tax=Rhizobium rhizogenes TaxID=359 RepID=A0A546X3I2_RHIRH|nr:MULTISPECIES: inositol monophosphatase family protein [Rhizobium/Agrobacterium group]TRA95257.1 3'(2'),5'-bisphosphate nucleotidase CysQ [Rhizobium rhizogenes]